MKFQRLNFDHQCSIMLPLFVDGLQKISGAKKIEAGNQPLFL